MQLYIYKNGQQQGPYHINQVKAWLNSGYFNEKDWAWYDGTTDWIPLQLVPGILEIMPSLQTTNQDLSDFINVKVVCPKCDLQNLYGISKTVSDNTLQCPNCGTIFLSRMVKIRSKNSRGSQKEFMRRFSVRVYELTGHEELIEFVNAGTNDFELRSRDFALFTYLEDRLSVVQNLTVHRYMKISSPSCFLATYVYGASSEKVTLLRHFRDSVLLTSQVLSPIVPFYYSISKKIVGCFGRSSAFKKLSYICLEPLIWGISLYIYRHKD